MRFFQNSSSQSIALYFCACLNITSSVSMINSAPYIFQSVYRLLILYIFESRVFFFWHWQCIVSTQMTIGRYKCFWLTCIFLEGPPFFQHILLPLLPSSKGAEWSMPTAKSPKSWNFYLEDHVHLAGEQRRYLCLQLLHLHLQGLSDIKIYRCENNLHGYIIYGSSWIYG